MPLAPAYRARLQASLACAGAATMAFFFRHPATLVVFSVATLLAIVAWTSPRLYAPVQRGLDAITHAFLAAITWTVFGLVYFGVFTPFRFVRALTTRDPLALRRPPVNDSYFQPISSSGPRFDRQF